MSNHYSSRFSLGTPDHGRLICSILDPGAGRTALMEMSRHGNVETIKFLIDKGAKPNARDELGRTPLIWAARSGHAEVVKLLIEMGAELNARDQSGCTALRFARGSVVKEILEKSGAII